MPNDFSRFGYRNKGRGDGENPDAVVWEKQTEGTIFRVHDYSDVDGEDLGYEFELVLPLSCAM